MEKESNKSYRKQVKLLFIAELLTIVASIFTAFFILASWCGVVASIINLIAVIMMLIAVIKLRKANAHFKRSFTFLILNIILTVLSIIFVGLGFKQGAIIGALTTLIVLCVLSCLRLINNIVIICNIVYGCKKLVISEKKDDDFGKYSITIYTICTLVAIILTILVTIPSIGDNNALATAFSAITSIATTLASIIYIVTLGRTVKRLK